MPLFFNFLQDIPSYSQFSALVWQYLSHLTTKQPFHPCSPILYKQAIPASFVRTKFFSQPITQNIEALNLNYARPDLSYSVSILNQFSSAPKQGHWQAIVRVLRYLVNTLEYASLLEEALSLLATWSLIGQMILILRDPYLAIVLCQPQA